MGRNRRRVTAPRIATVLSVLLVGAAFYAVNDSERRGTQVEECAEAVEAADSTITVYTDGSNLKGDYDAAIADPWETMDIFKVMEQGGKLSSLHVAVEVGGSTRWKLDEIDGVPYVRFPLIGDGISSMGPMEIRNMGDADILTDFINYGARSYPANHYRLILWDHGGGPVGGYRSDSHFDEDGLSLEEIREALGHSAVANSASDFMAPDACLMGSMETVNCLDGCTDYVIASPELKPQHGYNYRWMAALGDSLSPDMEWGEAVGRSTVEAYGACYASDTASVAMNLLDMKGYPAFHGVFHQYVSGIPEKPWEELYEELGRGRMKMLAFGSRQAGGSLGLVDMLGFLNTCQRVYPDENAPQTLKDRMRRPMAKQWAKDYPVNPSGLTTYLPNGFNSYLSEVLETYNTTGFCSAYRWPTDGYAAYLVRESRAEWGNIGVHKNGTVEISIVPEDASDVTEAHLAVLCPTGDDENYCLLCTDSDVDIGVNGTLWAVPKDSYIGMKGQVLCLTGTMNLDAYTEYMALVLYDGELCTMRIEFDEEHEDGQILSVVPASQTSETAKRTYELEEGDRMILPHPTECMEDVGEAPGNTDNVLDQIIEGGYYANSYYMGTEFYMEEPDDMLLEAVPASGDGYLYGFMLMDVRQNTYCTSFIGMGTEDNGS